MVWMDYMKTKVALLGSCISRDVFNSHFVPNYKEFFEVITDVQRTTLISLMQDPVEIEECLIDISPHNSKNIARTRCISNDLNKFFLRNLIEMDVDYLIIDNYFEVLYGILYYDNTIISNNFWDLPETQFYQNMSDKLNLNLYENFDEYFCIWSKYCDLFFKFLALYCPNVKVILNQARQTNQVMKSDGSCYINNDFTKTMNSTNPLLEKLDSYIMDNFNVHVLRFDYDNTYCDESHIWGFAPMHFHKNYHDTLFNKLKSIIFENQSLDIVSNNYKNILNEDSFKKDLKRANFETQIFLNLALEYKNTIRKLENSLKFSEELLSSNSWKATKPLRSFKKILKRKSP